VAGAGGIEDDDDNRIVVVVAAVVVAVGVFDVSNSPEASENSSHPLALRTLDPPSRRAKADARASKRLFIGGARAGEQSGREDESFSIFFFRATFLNVRARTSEVERKNNLLFSSDSDPVTRHFSFCDVSGPFRALHES